MIIEAPSIPKLKAREKDETGSLVSLPTNLILSDLMIIGSLKVSLLLLLLLTEALFSNFISLLSLILAEKIFLFNKINFNYY